MAKKSTWLAKTKQRRVLYIITKSVWGGAAKYVYDLASRLPKDKFTVSIAAGGQGKFAQKIKEANLPYFEIKNFQKSVNPFKDAFAFFEILKLLFKLKPGVVHVNSSKAGGIVGVASLIYKILYKIRDTRYKIQTVFTAHGWAFAEDRPKWQIFLVKLFSKITALFYDKIICVSGYDRHIALKNKIAPAKKLITIHNGIDISQLVFLSKEKAREKLLLTSNFQPQTSKVIGTIAEWNKNKGLFYLLEAAKNWKGVRVQHQLVLHPNPFPQNFQTAAPIAFVLIGSGENPDKEKMYDFVKKHNLENVHLIEWVDMAATYLKAFDIFVLPSVKEGFPYTILEAMAAELPIITTAVGGIPEAIENNVNGIFVQPKNSQQLTEKILYLIDNPEKAQLMAQKAKEKVEREFSLEKMLKETKSLYN